MCLDFFFLHVVSQEERLEFLIRPSLSDGTEQLCPGVLKTDDLGETNPGYEVLIRHESGSLFP